MINISVDLKPISEPEPPLPFNVPNPVVPPKCWEVKEGDGQKPAIQLHDYDETDRETSLGETNATHSHYQFVDGRIKPPKHIVNLQNTTWLDWQYDILGARNFEQKAGVGDGWEDTNEDSVPVFLENGSINPLKARKQMCGNSGGCLYNVLETIVQGGVEYLVVETMDFFNFPTKIGNTWFQDGVAKTWETHPHLFNSRVNRKMVKEANRTWITKRGVMGCSDGGLVGGKMKEWWPNPSKVPVTQPRVEGDKENVRLFPELPFSLNLFKESLIVDGELVPQLGGIVILADAYRFYGSKVFVRDKISKMWYLADEMLVRASLFTGWYANALDYRCHAAFPGSQEPWMGDRGHGVPDPGIFRKDQILYSLLDILFSQK